MKILIVGTGRKSPAVQRKAIKNEENEDFDCRSRTKKSSDSREKQSKTRKMKILIVGAGRKSPVIREKGNQKRGK